MSIVDFDTECWDDPWIQERSPLAKLLFVYLWTNAHRNVSGMYIITKKTIGDETGLTRKQVDDLLQEIEPKVRYDPVHSVCWVVKHVRRQFLRHGKTISDKVRIGIRNAALKLCYHPFFQAFVDQYPEIFSQEEKETLSRQSADYPGGGKGKGEGNVKGKEEKRDRGLGEEEKEEEGQPPQPNERDNLPELMLQAFDKFLASYPSRNGKKSTKEESKEYFLRHIKPKDIPSLLLATENYANSRMARGNYAKDPIRFLKKNYWRDWIEPEEEDPDPYESLLKEKEEREAKRREKKDGALFHSIADFKPEDPG